MVSHSVKQDLIRELIKRLSDRRYMLWRTAKTEFHYISCRREHGNLTKLLQLLTEDILEIHQPCARLIRSILCDSKETPNDGPKLSFKTHLLAPVHWMCACEAAMRELATVHNDCHEFIVDCHTQVSTAVSVMKAHLVTADTEALFEEDLECSSLDRGNLRKIRSSSVLWQARVTGRLSAEEPGEKWQLLLLDSQLVIVAERASAQSWPSLQGWLKMKRMSENGVSWDPWWFELSEVEQCFLYFTRPGGEQAGSITLVASCIAVHGSELHIDSTLGEYHVLQAPGFTGEPSLQQWQLALQESARLLHCRSKDHVPSQLVIRVDLSQVSCNSVDDTETVVIAIDATPARYTEAQLDSMRDAKASRVFEDLCLAKGLLHPLNRGTEISV